MPKIIKFFSFWFPPVFWMGIIFSLSSFHKIQVTDVTWANFLTRKLAHFLEYALLSFLLTRALRGTTKLSLKKNLFLSGIGAVIYAISDEYHQTFISGRTGRSTDIGIDSLGVLFGLIFFGKISKFLPKKIQELLL